MRALLGIGGVLLGITGGLYAGWVRGAMWEAHHEYDRSEGVPVCFVDAILGGVMGFIAGSAAVSLAASVIDRRSEPTA